MSPPADWDPANRCARAARRLTPQQSHPPVLPLAGAAVLPCEPVFRVRLRPIATPEYPSTLPRPRQCRSPLPLRSTSLKFSEALPASRRPPVVSSPIPAVAHIGSRWLFPDLPRVSLVRSAPSTSPGPTSDCESHRPRPFHSAIEFLASWPAPEGQRAPFPASANAPGWLCPSPSS